MGIVAAMIAARPLGMYFTAQVNSPLPPHNIRVPITNNFDNTIFSGNLYPRSRKKPISKIPAINCLMPASVMPCMCLTPMRLARYVVPQKILTIANAIYALLLVLRIKVPLKTFLLPVEFRPQN
jgi:hypothetical protein